MIILVEALFLGIDRHFLVRVTFIVTKQSKQWISYGLYERCVIVPMQ